MADLSVNIGNLKLSNPVMTASGTFGYGKEFEDFVDLETPSVFQEYSVQLRRNWTGSLRNSASARGASNLRRR